MIRNPSEPDGPGKSGASTRSNPVCLEVGVTLRSLPGQANSPTQPIREDLKTVIVFENGAVLRSANNLPAGTSVILSNSNARDVVCRVVTGRSMPSVKGYVEVEFMEPVKDFWGIQQDSAPASAVPVPAAKSGAPTAAPEASTETPKASLSSSLSSAPPERPVFTLPARPEAVTTPKPTPAIRQTPASNRPPTGASEALAGTPEFEEFPTPLSSLGMPVSSSKAEPKATVSLGPSGAGSGIGTKAPAIPENPVTGYSHSDSASATSVANWTPPQPEPAATKHVVPTSPEPMSAFSSGPAPARDFMSQGLMAYEKEGGASTAAGGQKKLMLAAAVIVLAVVSGAAFFMSRGGSAAVAKGAVSNAPAVSQPAPANDSHAAAPAAPAQAAQQFAPAASKSEAQSQAQTVAAQPIQPSEAVAPIPSAEIADAANSDAHLDSRGNRRQDRAAPAKQPDAASTKRPKMADLKMSAPAAPNRSIGDASESAPIAEIASANVPAASAPTALLSSTGRTAGQPAPPAAPAPPPMKVVTDPKLISSTSAVYPESARQANIEGSVTVMAYIDPTGKVFSARSINGPVMLRAAAEQAVKQWKYSPGLEDGKPVQSHALVKVDFKLH